MIFKGDKVIFELTTGEEVQAPPTFGLLHDPSGKERSDRYVFCGPFSRDGEPAPPEDVSIEARAYLGKTHRMKVGGAEIPNGPWTRVGKLSCVCYDRSGSRAPGKMYHDFNTPHGTYHVVHLVKGRGVVTLYRCGRWYRMSFPKNALIDDRGFVWP